MALNLDANASLTDENTDHEENSNNIPMEQFHVSFQKSGTFGQKQKVFEKSEIEKKEIRFCE